MSHPFFRRGRIEYVLDCLSTLEDGPKRISHVMQEANLQYNAAKNLLFHLGNLGIVMYDEEYYSLTAWGMECLGDAKKLLTDLQVGQMAYWNRRAVAR